MCRPDFPAHPYSSPHYAARPRSEGQGQGLFVCLPGEELTLAGFAQDGRSDTMAPGALLATLLDAITGEGGSGLAGVGDDQLIGIVSAARRMESRAAWTLMAALAELARRRARTRPAAARSRPGRTPGCAGSGRIQGTPGCRPGSCRRMRCWPPGSMWSSGRWTCAPPG